VDDRDRGSSPAVPARLLAAAREEVLIRGYSFVSQRIMFLMGPAAT
jgi:hypothetical protein